MVTENAPLGKAGGSWMKDTQDCALFLQLATSL